VNTHGVLADLLTKVTCKPGWSFALREKEGGFKTLVITIPVVDSRGGSFTGVDNSFPVPEATYNMKSWRRWVFECCRKVEDHELGEWFIVDGERPFAPLHGPGCDPYPVRELETEEEADTDQAGVVLPDHRKARQHVGMKD
jgi:hypothetical protein